MVIEIKFRAWDEDNERMGRVEDYLNIKPTNGKEYWMCKAFGDFMFMALSHEWKLMQYTGLKDKNGKEIYEGDILKPYDVSDNQFLSVIIMKHGCFGYDSSGGDFVPLGRNHHYFNLMEGSHQSHILEIIGNIYENPEILK
jgi:uncharacterized phage protein (TIGR01671 family)